MAISHFARALGAARSGKPDVATADIAKLAELHDKLCESKDSYWAEIVDIQRQVAGGRSYAIGDHHATAKSALAIAFHNRCDLIVAKAAIGDDQPGAHEAPVLEFLNGEVVLRWAEVTLGL